jgi:hypothetical protein
LATIPRIVRAVPRGSVTRPGHALPVIASIRWHDGRDTDVPAFANAWTSDAVEITWDAPGLGLRTDWIPAEDVRRTQEPRSDQPPRLPTSRGRTSRPRW